MTGEAILRLLRTLGQEHLGEGIDTLSLEQLKCFYEGLCRYGSETLLEQRKALASKKHLSLSGTSSFAYKEICQSRAKLGRAAVSEGRVACLVLAGGQGTRLGVNGPKGKVKVSPIGHKTLFQMICEKVDVLSRQMNYPLQLAFLASSKNFQETCNYFLDNKWFGLDPLQVSIFCQEDLPFLSSEGNWLLESPGALAVGPNGNGKALYHLQKEGIWDKWLDAGVDYVNVIQIDNPLADPFDEDLIGLHEEHSTDVTMKVIKRSDAQENVGIVVCKEGSIKVVEYSDLSCEERGATNKEGGLLLPFANIGLMAFSMQFIRKSLEKISQMPLHLAYKSGQFFSHGMYHSDKIWKFEYFIFDLLDFTKNVSIVKAEREDCYAPLKSASGDKSLATVQHSLFHKYKKIYSNLSGLSCPDRDFELDTAFFYPTEEMKSEWKKRPLPEKDYIKPETL